MPPSGLTCTFPLRLGRSTEHPVYAADRALRHVTDSRPTAPDAQRFRFAVVVGVRLRVIVHNAAVDENEFWTIVEEARAGLGDDRDNGEALAEALVQRLVAGPADIIAGFGRRLDRLHDALYRWDVWAAAYLIGGGCSDDSFMDFRAGVIALGREWYERVLASPDALADHPVIRRAAAEEDDEAVFAEAMLYADGKAMEQLTGDEHAYDNILDEAGQDPGRDPFADPAGEDFDFDDDAEMHRRLPRLAALYLPA